MSRIEAAFQRARTTEERGERVHAVPVPDAAAMADGAPVLNRYRSEPPAQSPPETRVPPPPAALEPVRQQALPQPRQEPRFYETPSTPLEHNGKLVTTAETDPLAIEQYRRLAAALEQLQTQGTMKSLMVSSALPREGKTLTVTNLALTLSESFRRRVLLIDADFHRPSVHHLFGIANITGLADALDSREGDMAGVPIVRVSARLSVLPTGKSDDHPIARLSSERLRQLVEEASAEFDWVLLDTPPIGLLTDARLVARATDGVLMVIAAGMTPYTLVQRSLAEIGEARVIGTVLNRVEGPANPMRHYYTDHYAGRS